MRIFLHKINGRFAASIGTAAGRAGAAAAALPMKAPGLVATLCAAIVFVAVLALSALFSRHLPHLAFGAHAHAHALSHGLQFAVAGAAGTTADVTKIINELERAFKEFRDANDERLKQIETKGSADAALVNKVEQANSAVTTLEKKLDETQKQLRDVETAQARGLAGGKADEKELDTVRAFMAFTQTKARGRVVAMREIGRPTDGDVEHYRAYVKAFDTYLRQGEKGLPVDVMNALQTGSDPNGGYFLEPDRQGRIVQLIFESSPIRQLASVDTISTDAREGELDLDEVSSGWVGETEARPETGTAQKGEYRIQVWEQYAMPKISQRELDDASRDVGAWLEGKTADKMSRVENAGFTIGDGVKKPRGLLSYPTVAAGPGAVNKSTWGKVQQYATGVAGAFAATNPGDVLIDMVFGLKPAYLAGANWIMSRYTQAQARKLKDGQGNYLWQRDFTKQFGGTLLDYPIVSAEDMPQLAGNSLSVAFGNFKEAYQVLDHTRGLQTLRDNLTQKPWVLFYTSKRVGGGVVNFDAYRVLKFG